MVIQSLRRCVAGTHTHGESTLLFKGSQHGFTNELAAALHTSGSTCRMTLMCNCIGFAGYSAIIRALEARHGQELAHYISTAVMNAPYFLPRFLIFSLSRGARFYQERGVFV